MENENKFIPLEQFGAHVPKEELLAWAIRDTKSLAELGVTLDEAAAQVALFTLYHDHLSKEDIQAIVKHITEERASKALRKAAKIARILMEHGGESQYDAVYYVCQLSSFRHLTEDTVKGYINEKYKKYK